MEFECPLVQDSGVARHHVRHDANRRMTAARLRHVGELIELFECRFYLHATNGFVLDRNRAQIRIWAVQKRKEGIYTA